MDNFPALVMNDKKHKQNFKCRCGYSKEIHRTGVEHMVFQEGTPCLRRWFWL